MKTAIDLPVAPYLKDLPPMPGGKTNYLDTIHLALTAIETHRFKRNELERWFVAEYQIHPDNVKIYVNIMVRLHLITCVQDDKMLLTERGQEVLRADRPSQSVVLLQEFLSSVIGAREALTIYAAQGRPVSSQQLQVLMQPKFASWKDKGPYCKRANWLLALGAINEVSEGVCQINAFGKAMLTLSNLVQSAPRSPLPLVIETIPNPVILSELDTLVLELNQAARDTQNWQRFELALVQAFGFLGFQTVHCGGNAEPDVVVTAPLLVGGYTFIVEARTQNRGQVADIEPQRMHEHRNWASAEVVVVVGEGFTGDRVIRDAKQYGIVLLPLAVLIEWLQLHVHTPLNLEIYHAVLTLPGLLVQIPQIIQAAADDRRRFIDSLVRFIHLFERRYERGWREPLSADTVRALLHDEMSEKPISAEEVDSIFQFLCHPALNCAYCDPQGGLVLIMTSNTIAHCAAALSKGLVLLNQQSK